MQQCLDPVIYCGGGCPKSASSPPRRSPPKSASPPPPPARRRIEVVMEPLPAKAASPPKAAAAVAAKVKKPLSLAAKERMRYVKQMLAERESASSSSRGSGGSGRFHASYVNDEASIGSAGGRLQGRGLSYSLREAPASVGAPERLASRDESADERKASLDRFNRRIEQEMEGKGLTQFEKQRLRERAMAERRKQEYDRMIEQRILAKIPLAQRYQLAGGDIPDVQFVAAAQPRPKSPPPVEKSPVAKKQRRKRRSKEQMAAARAEQAAKKAEREAIRAAKAAAREAAREAKPRKPRPPKRRVSSG